jgi:hypothetical protein
MGAFNLLRTDAYRSVGGHEPLRLSVVDDVELGGLVKAKGFRQRCLDGSDWIQVYWQPGLRGIFNGLEKNIYAGFGYSMPVAAVGALASLLTGLLPLALAYHGHWWLLAGLLVTALVTTDYLPCLGAPRWGAVLFPLGACLFCCIICYSVYRTEKQGGVRWRDTFYPLSELRAAT